MKKNTTKKSFLMSVVSMMLCVTLLIGTTLAWFTDTATSGINRIIAGNLDVGFRYLNAKTSASWRDVDATTDDLFVNTDGSGILWEPGAVSVVYLEIKNNGSLALKYQLSSAFIDTVTGADGAALSDVLTTAVVELTDAPSASTFTRETAKAVATAAGAKSLKEYVFHGELAKKNDTKYLAMIIYYPEELGNIVNGKLYNTGDVQLETQLGLSLVATQLSYESDGFDNLYDVDANIPGADIPRIINFSKSVTVTTGQDTVINNNSSTVIVTVPSGSANEGDLITLSVTNTTAPDALVFDDYVNATVAYNIELIGRTDDSQPVTVQIFFGKGMDVKAVYHNNVSIPFTYDSDSGYITFTTNTFSPFTIAYTVPEIAITKDDDETVPAQYMTLPEFRDYVNEGNSLAGYTATLLQDVDLAGLNWVPISNYYRQTDSDLFAGTFNGNNKIIYNLTISVLEDAPDGKYFCLGLFGSVGAATIKNLTLANVSITAPRSSYVGALCGESYAAQSSFTNITVSSGIISGGWHTGGIVGCLYYNSTLSDCSNAATVSGIGFTGGIIGVRYNNNSAKSISDFIFSNCTNNGAVDSQERSAGGIAGKITGATMTNCVNTGSVTANDVLSGNKEMPAGGIVGTLDNYVKIENCRNSGNVRVLNTSNANSGAGGIAGNNGNSTSVTISFCINTGNVNNEKSAASGILSNLYGGVPISNCFNSGNVTGANTAGGISAKPTYGTTNASTNCINAGTVTATNSSSTTYMISPSGMTNCYYYAGDTLKTSANANADTATALTALNNGLASDYWGLDNGVIKPLILIP